MSYDAFDSVEVRCPKLGHELNFGYCRTVESGMPCARALQCFSLRFPVEEFFKRVLEEETFSRVFAPPTENRVSSLLRLADKSKS